MKLVFEPLTDNPAASENSKSQITRGGHDVSDITHEDIVHLASNKDHFKFEVDPASLVLPMLKLVSEYPGTVIGCSKKHVTATDYPVAMAPVGRPAPGWAPGFGRADTTVSAALTSRYAYIGMPTDVPRRAMATREDVAELNRLTATNAASFVYSEAEKFLWMRLDRTINKSSQGNGPSLTNLDILDK